MRSNDGDASVRSIMKRAGVIGGLALIPLIVATISLLADVADLVNLFSQRWQIVTVVVGASFAIAGALLLIRLWHDVVGLPVIGAVALASLGFAALVFGVVSVASPTEPSTNGDATQPRITSPLPNFRTSDTKIAVRVSAPLPDPGSVYMIAVEPSRQHNRYYFHHLVPEEAGSYRTTAGIGPKDYEKGRGFYAIRLVVVDKQLEMAIDDHMEQAGDYNESGMAVPAGVMELHSVVVERVP